MALYWKTGVPCRVWIWEVGIPRSVRTRRTRKSLGGRPLAQGFNLHLSLPALPTTNTQREILAGFLVTLTVRDTAQSLCRCWNQILGYWNQCPISRGKNPTVYCVGHIGIAFLTAVFLRTLTRRETVGMAFVLGILPQYSLCVTPYVEAQDSTFLTNSGLMPMVEGMEKSKSPHHHTVAQKPSSPTFPFLTRRLCN